MTIEQYERWKDFALRMARTCFKRYRRPSQAWIIEQVESWFYWRDFQKDCGEYNSWDQDDYPLCDHISEFYEDCRPSLNFCKACRHDDCRKGYPHYEDSCPMCDLECRCDASEELAWEQYERQWLGPVHCCIRAGIDMAVEQSAGVAGFTAGDVRRMYPEGVPDWMFPEPLETIRVNRVVPGVGFIPEPTGVMNAFAELPDNSSVWL